MNSLKFVTRHRLVGAAILCVLLVAGCGPAPLGTGWPSVSMVTTECGEQTQLGIMVAYTDRIAIVNPATGEAVDLLNQDCEPRPPDADGSAKVWDFRSENGSRQFYSAPLQLDDETLLAIAYDQHLLRIDLPAARAENPQGVPIEGRSGHTVADPIMNGDLIYLGLSAKDLIALNAQTFDVEWTVPTNHGVWSKPLVVDDVIYFSSLDHKLYAADAENGELLWSLDLGGALTSTPFYYEDRLYIGSFARKIYEISLDGEISSEYMTSDWVWGTPVVVDGTLYAADLGGYVYAIDVQAGLREIWKQKVADNAIRPTPVIAGDVLIVASRDQKLYWLNRSDGTMATDSEGNVLVRELQSPILSDIMLIEPGENVDVTEPIIVVSTLAPQQLLVAYTLDNGELAWPVAYAFQ